MVVEGTACPVLRGNLEGILRVFRSWFPHVTTPALEAEGGFSPSVARSPARTGALFSGGVDAIAMLRRNRLDLPLGHPGSLAEAVYVFGLHGRDFRDGQPQEARRADFRRQAERIRRLGELASFEVSTVGTNASLLHPTYEAWHHVGWLGGTLAAAFALAPRFTDLLFASGGLALAAPPHASHPMVDACYSSAAVRVRPVQTWVTRMEKVGLLAGWEECWPYLRPCLVLEESGGDRPNCGRCEKCVRTMLEFLAWGVLDRMDAFPERDVRPETVRALPTVRTIRALYYDEALFEGLRRRGRADLVRALGTRVSPPGEGALGRLLRHLRGWREATPRRRG